VDNFDHSLRSRTDTRQGKDVAGIKVHDMEVGAVDAKAVRKKLDLTQDQMATVLGTSPSGYKKWEQGKRHRSGAGGTLLRIMERGCAASPVV